MAKFEQLLLKNVPHAYRKTESEVLSWGLVISSIEELDKYHNYDAYANTQALLCMETNADGSVKTSHLGAVSGRQTSLAKYLAVKQMCAPVGKRVYPLLEVAELTDRKYASMANHITNHGAIRINEAGGYCDNEGFKKTWNAEVLQTIEKDDIGFPVDDEVLNADTICLENAHADYSTYMAKKAMDVVPNHGTVGVIYNLREVDRAYVFECLKQCKNVFIESEFLDDEQVNGFMQLFSKLPPKNVYLKTGLGFGFNSIKMHPLFDANLNLHKITFCERI